MTFPMTDQATLGGWCISREFSPFKEKKQGNILKDVYNNNRGGPCILRDSDSRVMNLHYENCTYFSVWHFHLRGPWVQCGGKETKR